MNLLESQNIQNLLENRLFWRKNSNKRLWAWLIPKTISVKKGRVVNAFLAQMKHEKL